MTGSRMLRLAAVVTLGLALAGCGRFHVDLEVTSDNTVNGEIIVAIIEGDDENAEANARAAADDLEQRLLPGLRDAEGVTVEPYNDDGYVGSRLILLGTPLSVFDGSDAFTLERDGDSFQFAGAVTLTEEDAQQDDIVSDDGERDVIVSLLFPGEVTSHNGESTGQRVEWSSDWNGTLDMRATAMAERPGPPAWAWLAASITIALLIGAIVALALRGRDSTIAAPATVTTPPEPELPDTVPTVPTVHSVHSVHSVD